MGRWYGLSARGMAGFVAAVALLGWSGAARAVPLDKDGDIKLGVRSYVNARIQTEHTDRNMVFEPTDPSRPISNADNPPLEVQESQTFPYSPPGNLRQNRLFIEA